MTIRTNTVRIISGKWRGRKLVVARVKHLRPTTDRARETIFNWLTREIPDASVLDLFAGTGVLGFESLSRGARRANFVEINRKVITRLKETNAELNANATIHENRASDFLKKTQAKWDIVFVDPPFGEPFHYLEILRLLESHLTKEGFVYIEHPAHMQLVLKDYEIWKETKIGNVFCKLVRPKTESLKSRSINAGR